MGEIKDLKKIISDKFSEDMDVLERIILECRTDSERISQRIYEQKQQHVYYEVTEVFTCDHVNLESQKRFRRNYSLNGP